MERAEHTEAKRRLVAAGSGLAVLLAALGTSAANVALPKIADDFGASMHYVQWVVIGYLLALTVTSVEAGRLGDRFGHSRMLLAGIALFALAAGLGAASPTLAVLVIARLAQGAGAALMMALPLALARETVVPGRLGQAMGLMGTMSAIGTALGPSLGGVILAGVGWRGMFAALAIAAAATMPLLTCAPRRRSPAAATVPPARGATVVFALAVSAYALAMTAGGGLALPALVAAIGLAVVFWRLDRGAAAPMLPRDELSDPALRASLAMNAIVGAVMMATLVVGPFYLSGGLGLGTLQVGLAMSVGPVLSALSGVPAGRIVDRLGAPAVIRLALLIMIAGAVGLAILPARLGLAGYLMSVSLLTPGYQMFLAANTAQTMVRASDARRGVVSGLLGLSRNLGLVTGAALMGSVFAWASGGVAEGGTVGLAVTFGLAAGLLIVALSVAGSASRVRVMVP